MRPSLGEVVRILNGIAVHIDQGDIQRDVTMANQVTAMVWSMVWSIR
jgi:hypothetical protein